MSLNCVSVIQGQDQFVSKHQQLIAQMCVRDEAKLEPLRL